MGVFVEALGTPRAKILGQTGLGGLGSPLAAQEAGCRPPGCRQRERFLSGERIEVLVGNSKSEQLWRKSRLRWLAGTWGFDWEKKKKKALKLSMGSGRLSQNMNLVGGLMVVVLLTKTGRYHRFVPRLDLRVPGKRRPRPPPPVAEILILTTCGHQRFGVTFPKHLGN